MSSVPIKMMCVMCQLLGNKMISDRYMTAFEKMGADIELSYLPVGIDDYSAYPSRFYEKISNALRFADVTKRKFRDFKKPEYDILFVNGYEMAYGLVDEIKKHPTILALDATPRLAHEALLKVTDSRLKRLRSVAASAIVPKLFNEMFTNVDFFMPLTKWCGEALSAEYGARPEDIYATYCPVDLNVWAPGPKTAEGITLLFVGNGFYRKGGDIVLRVFERLSSEGLRLIIVSNDQGLSADKMPRNVELYSNVPHNKILGLFKSADIFVFPTKKEYLGSVTNEAAAVGIPVVARDVGGIKEFIIDGHNGFLMPYYSTDDQWYEKIKYLIDHPQERKRMGENGRKIAEEKFSLDNFEQMVKEVAARAIQMIER